MRTWEDYKEHVKNSDIELAKVIEEAEILADISKSGNTLKLFKPLGLALTVSVKKV